jgi:type I restriction enzyme, S subunit
MNKKLKLGDVCDLQNGFAFKSGDYIEKSNTLNIRMSNIRPNGSFNEMHKIRYLPDSYAEKYKEFLLKENDLIIAMTDMAGEPKILGLPTLVKNLDGRKFLLNQRVGKLHKFSEEIYVPYLCYFLQTLKEYYKNKGAGGLQINISKNEILSANIILKPITQQKQIVAKLDASFAEIDKTILNVEKKLTNTIKLANAILSKIFEKNDSGWKDIVLKDVCNNITDGKHGDCKPQENSGFYFLSAKDVKNNILNYEKARQITKDDFLETHRRTNLEPGDLLITNSGTIGRMAIADDNLKTYQTTFQKSVAILKPIHDAVNNKFLFYLLKSKLKYFTNISQGTAQKNLLLRDIREMKIKLPVSLAEQVKISRKCENLFNYIKEIELTYKKKHENLIQLKQSILTQELSGEFKRAS